MKYSIHRRKDRNGIMIHHSIAPFRLYICSLDGDALTICAHLPLYLFVGRLEPLALSRRAWGGG